MNLGNETGIFRPTGIRRAVWLSLGLLGGCSHAVRKEAPPPPVPLVDIGVPACNAYLNSYLACHRAAHILPPSSLESHYQAMLASLRQSAADPQVRPYLANRCIGLTQQLNAALQGRSCSPASGVAAPTVPASTTPVRP
ncbi:hypothetical protein [Dyella mobilis]|uniref:Uncharacterized protein n=1 Tax=Dyella mobilis TaxID=1849582 RepID=A0ABS2KKR0_9GAMM|nr:hypothetical protein [Dyella mobilis]MBM7131741.1 hypothetical protein [Dyella mobilis]GLQ96282.1 hypothetical protein GCM10007863_07000 [Dyella mobilis]